MDGSPKGVDWVPPAAEPARRVLVPPGPGGAGGARLYLLAPGDQDGTAEIRMIGKEGTFTPAGAESVQLTGDRVASVDVGKPARGEPVAIQIDSSVPVVAAVRAARGTAGKTPDLGYLAGTRPLANGAVIADSRTGKGEAARVYLTAPAAEARATVSTVASGEAGGEPSSVDVVVPAGTTAALTLKPPAGASTYAVVVTPQDGSGPLYGSWAQFAAAGGGEMFTTLALVDDRATVVVPRVGHDLSAGISRSG